MSFLRRKFPFGDYKKKLSLKIYLLAVFGKCKKGFSVRDNFLRFIFSKVNSNYNFTSKYNQHKKLKL